LPIAESIFRRGSIR